MDEDEPFDSRGPAPEPGPELRRSKPSVPPMSAFGGSAVAPPSAAPPMSAFGGSAVVSSPSESPPRPTRVSPEPAASGSSDDRWKRSSYDLTMDKHRSESNLGAYLKEDDDDDEGALRPRTPSVSSSSASQRHSYKNYGLYDSSSQIKASAELAPRQPYAFTKSTSYDTNELIRKYSGMAAIPPMVSSTPRTTSPTAPVEPLVRTDEVRGEALRVLDMVESRFSGETSPYSMRRTSSTSGGGDLRKPIDVQRTQSGGFRAGPGLTDSSPYSMRRTSSTNNNGGKRVLSALSGMDMPSTTTSNQERNDWKSSRFSFADPKFRDDDHFSEDDYEDEIIRPGPFRDEPVVDVEGLDLRAAASQASEAEQSFDGDFPHKKNTWSNRYSDAGTYTSSQKMILDQWDREFETGRKGPRNMIMATASNIQSAASNVFSSNPGSNKGSIFGSGFNFRSSNVYGKHKKPQVNLRTVWKDVEGDEQDPNMADKGGHKTWQEVMLSKKRRRRFCGGLLILILAGIAATATLTSLGKKNSNTIAAAGKGDLPVPFYVTSDVPYNQNEEDKFVKDVANIPNDADFMIHLGNIQDASISMCPETRYSDVASILKKSPMTTFVVPGEEDWVNCPDPAYAWEYWGKSFNSFDDNFKHSLNVYRDRTHPTSFAILHQGVLFIGMHLVGGPIHDQDSWSEREAATLKFFFGMTNMHKGDFRALVLLGNARIGPRQQTIMTALSDGIARIGVPTAYVHANSGDANVLQYQPFPDNTNFYAIGVEDGGQNPPLKITVGYGKRPFMVG